MLEFAKWGVLALAVLVAAGGIIGFVKAKSKASLIAGGISGALLAVAFVISLSQAVAGLIMADLVALIVGIMFLFRLRKTGKFMPSGLLLILCAISVILSTAALVGSFRNQPIVNFNHRLCPDCLA